MGAALLPVPFVPLTEPFGRMLGYFIAYIVFEALHLVAPSRRILLP
jgi:hypothetical protein